MTIKKTSLLSVVMGSAALVASTPSAIARPWGTTDRHGAIVVAQRTVRAIATGPTLLHVYSGASGGMIFVAPFATGADGDCSGPVGDTLSRAAPLAADHVLILSVRLGEVACLATTADRSFELLWHARPLLDRRQ
jgi:hypothetical protein